MEKTAVSYYVVLYENHVCYSSILWWNRMKATSFSYFLFLCLLTYLFPGNQFSVLRTVKLCPVKLTVASTHSLNSIIVEIFYSVFFPEDFVLLKWLWFYSTKVLCRTHISQMRKQPSFRKGASQRIKSTL